MTDPDPTEDELRTFAHSLFAPEAEADDEPDESAEPDDDTRTTRSLFAPNEPARRGLFAPKGETE